MWNCDRCTNVIMEVLIQYQYLPRNQCCRCFRQCSQTCWWVGTSSSESAPKVITGLQAHSTGAARRRGWINVWLHNPQQNKLRYPVDGHIRATPRLSKHRGSMCALAAGSVLSMWDSASFLFFVFQPIKWMQAVSLHNESLFFLFCYINENYPLAFSMVYSSLMK